MLETVPGILQGQILASVHPTIDKRRHEIDRYGGRALMQHLKKRMLRVRAGLAPHW